VNDKSNIFAFAVLGIFYCGHFLGRVIYVCHARILC
jgi:hypothetical protein